jgi:sarcosine oxidase subunit beta
MNTKASKDADLLIIGGGILGAATAYYYKRDNPDKEVVVYEQNELCSGSTSVAAALLSRVRPYAHIIPLSLETYRVIPELEKITGDPLPVKYNGALHIASTGENVILLGEMMNISSSFNIEWEYITATRAEKMVPWLNASKAEKIVFVPGEAYTDPYLLASAFVNASKKLGVRYFKRTKVLEILKSDNVVTGIKSRSGFHNSEKTVLAAGVWSSLIAGKLGISLPMAPVRSQYWIAEISDSLFTSFSPTVIIPEANFYSRPQGNALLFGIREPESVYANPRDLPDNLDRYVFSPDNGWNDLISSFGKILPFFPHYGNTGIRNYVAGFSAYTPDSQFIAGFASEIEGLLLATGCNGAGISVAGGMGLGVSRLAAGKSNPFDFSRYNADRFGKIDEFSDEHLSRCAAARSRKASG